MAGRKNQRTKKQHYVPQFLLEKFAFDRKRKRVHVFDKRTGKARSAAIRDVAHENQFYDCRGQDGQGRNMEGFMERVDSMGSRVINKVVKQRSLQDLGPKERYDMACFVAAQFLRTHHSRNILISLNRHLVEKFGSSGDADGFLERAVEFSREDAADITAQVLSKDIPRYGEVLLAKDWVLHRAPDGGCSFYVSDNPVNLHNMIERPHRGNLGLMVEGIEIYMPLAPRLELAMLCPGLSVLAQLTPGLGVSEALETGEPILLRPENVTFHNSLQVTDSERFVFSDRDDFALAKEMVESDPELRRGPRLQAN